MAANEPNTIDVDTIELEALSRDELLQVANVMREMLARRTFEADTFRDLYCDAKVELEQLRRTH